MDELKLIQWKERFEKEVNNLQPEYNSFFLDRQLDDIYSIDLDESHEWALLVKEDIPNEIKNRLQQIFLAAKPEDSI